MEKKKIVVLAGGISTERDVSLNSGRKIYEALKRLGHEAILVDSWLGLTDMPEEIGEIFSSDRDWTEGLGSVRETAPDLKVLKAMRQEKGDGFFGPGVLAVCRQADLVFLGLHGEDGENGRVQATFDLLGVEYTGSGYLASALAMDKAITKELFLAGGVPTPGRMMLERSQDGSYDISGLSYPCVLKICHGGSSLGVQICRDAQEGQRALADLALFGDDILAEEYIEGREFSVGVLEGRALPVIEIAPVSGFYDYKNKYQPGATIETCPAQIPDEARDRMQAAAEKALQVLGMRDYGRVDFIMKADGSIYALEANSLPGMTATSLVPQEAEAAGIGFDELVQMLVDMHLK